LLVSNFALAVDLSSHVGPGDGVSTIYQLTGADGHTDVCAPFMLAQTEAPSASALRDVPGHVQLGIFPVNQTADGSYVSTYYLNSGYALAYFRLHSSLRTRALGRTTMNDMGDSGSTQRRDTNYKQEVTSTAIRLFRTQTVHRLIGSAPVIAEDTFIFSRENGQIWVAVKDNRDRTQATCHYTPSTVKVQNIDRDELTRQRRASMSPEERRTARRIFTFPLTTVDP
jgi:hypothetical protein